MKQDTLEEKIVREFFGACGVYISTSSPENFAAIKAWLLMSLTSYRNDVLEEVLAALPKEMKIHYGNLAKGHNRVLKKCRHLIKSLKVDIIKR